MNPLPYAYVIGDHNRLQTNKSFNNPVVAPLPFAKSHDVNKLRLRVLTVSCVYGNLPHMADTHPDMRMTGTNAAILSGMAVSWS